MRKISAGIGIILATVLIAGCQGAAENAKAGGKIGASAKDSVVMTTDKTVFPDFSVKNFAGNDIALKDYRGKIVILDLFATWCPPCRKEIPHFIELQNEYKDDLAVIGLSYDQAPLKKVQAFADEMKINYDLFWGSQEIAAYVGLRGIPHTLVIDQTGKIIQSYVGYRDKSVFENDIKSLLAEKTGNE